MSNIKKTDAPEMPKYHIKKNISAAQAVKILKKSNVEISESDAEKVLDLMYFLGELAVRQNFKKKEKLDNE